MNTNVIHYNKGFSNIPFLQQDTDTVMNMSELFQNLIQEENFQDACDLVKNCFLENYSEKSFYVLRESFQDLKTDIIFSDPWLIFYYAVIIKDSKPHIAIHLIKIAKNLFIKKNDPAGVILALNEIMQYYLTINRQYNKIKPVSVEPVIIHICFEHVNSCC